MKARLYEKNVVAYEPKMKQLRRRLVRSHYTRLILVILALIVTIAVSVICAMGISRGRKLSAAPLLFAPFAAKWAVLNARLLWDERECVKVRRLDPDDYSDWMKLHSRGNLTQEDLGQAVKLWKTYRTQYREQHSEIASALRALLQKKTNRPLSAGVLAGLLFLNADRTDRELLFWAHVRRGAAGRMIPWNWIRTLDMEDPGFREEHARQAKAFCAYWDNQAASNQNEEATL